MSIRAGVLIMSFQHIPVLLEETIAGLNLQPAGVYVDCTLGGAGHSLEIARRLSSGGLLIGLDQDPAAIRAAEMRLAAYEDRVLVIRSNFANLVPALTRQGIDQVDGIMFDLGVSSYQLDTPERGFSYQHDAPLDMRMDPEQPQSAYDLVNQLSEARLTEIIYRYGEERWAKRIAAFICQARQGGPITTTGALVEIIKRAIPAAARREGHHPAKRTFQAIRIAVNNELGILAQAVKDAVSLLKAGGRICVITFHSLEDRIVKDTFKELAHPCHCPPSFPVCVCGRKPEIKLITGKPVVSAEQEIDRNPRSRSAKLRVAEKI